MRSITADPEEARQHQARRPCLPLVLAAVLLLGAAGACGPAPTPAWPPSPTPSPTLAPPTKAAEHGWVLPAGKVLFIEHHVRTDGTCVEGDCAPGPMIDFPTYSFDPATGVLESRISVEMSDAVKVLYGDGQSLRGAAGGGAATGLTPIDTVPAEVDGLRIVQVEREGTAYLEYRGQLLVLDPGQTWTDTTVEDQVQDKGTVRLTRTEQIANYGILNKDEIVVPSEP